MADNYAEASLRHYQDADRLAAHTQYDNASHLVGFAAECAIKHAIESLRPAAEAPHVHFPALIEAAKRHLSGITNRSMKNVIDQPGFLGGWTVNQRYQANGTITQAQFTDWRRDASRAIGAAGLRRGAA